MYEIQYLQAVEPEALPRDRGVEVFVHDDLNRYGFPEVTLSGPDRDALIEYVREQWGDEDEAWFREYVVGRVVEVGTPPRRYLDVRYDITGLDDEQAGQLALEAQAQAESSDGHPGVEIEIETNESEDAVQRGGLDIEGAAVREVFERDGSSLIFVRVGFRGTDEGEVVLWVVNYEDPE